MTRAVLILHGRRDRQQAHAWIDKAEPGTSVEFKTSRRTNDQNALMWTWLTAIARGVEWYGQHLSAEDWKDVLSASLRRARVVPGIDPGSFVPLGMRTSDMTKDEFGMLLELIQAFAAERGVDLPQRDGSEAAA